MKHPLFALAGVAAMAALASDPSPRSGDIALDGFENYTAGQSVASASDSWTGSADAVVTAYGNGEAPTGIAFPAPFTDAGDQYLAIDTGSDEVTCSAESSAATVYIDTLAQFSVLKAGESAPVASDAKLLLWLQEDIDNGVTTTNLHVRGGYYGDLDNPTPKSYKLNAEGQPGVWYRVTIKSYKNIANENIEDWFISVDIPAFVISIDGNEVSASEAIIGSGDLSDYCPSIGGGDASEDCFNSDILALIQANKLIPAMGRATSETISQIAFKGNGAIDDLIVSANDPSSFLLSWPAGLTSVSYSLGQDPAPFAPLTPADGSSNITAVAGTFITLTGSAGYLTKTVTTNVVAGGSLSLPPMGIDYFFPQTNTAGQDGTAEHPFEINSINALNALKDAVKAGVGANLCYAQTLDINMANADPFEGIGTYADNPTNGVPFVGTYDGGGNKISNIKFTDRSYAGIFNQVNGPGTIKNLTVENADFVGSVPTKSYSASIVGNAGNGATLQNLVAAGSFGSADKPGNHNMAGIAIRLSGGGSGTLVKDCTNNAAIYGTYTKLGGICAITQHKVDGEAVTFDGCINNGALNLSRTSNGVTGFAGIVGYVQEDTVLVGCSNTGSINNTANGANTDKNGALVGWAYGKNLTDNGRNSATKTDKMVGNQTAGEGGQSVTGFKYATVENDIATTVLPPLTAGNTYLLEGNVIAAETAVATLASGETISFDTTLGYTFAGNVAAEAPLVAIPSTSGTLITYSTGYFPRTATAGQDGSAEHPFEIADEDDLQALRAYVTTTNCTGLSFVQTADIALTAAWPGIGVDAGKDKTAAEYEAGAFAGTYDGGNYTISNFSMVDGVDYGGLFNSINNATIKNLKMSWGSSTLCSNSSSSGDDTGATFVGTAKGSTLQNLTALAGTVTTVSASKDMAGIVGFVYAGSTIEACTNELNITSFKTSRKCGGIAVITQNGSGNAIFRNCYNSGTVTTPGTTYREGGIVGYVNVATTIDGCENTANVKLFHVEGSPTVTVTGTNKGYAGVASNDKSGGVTNLYFATVDGSVATFVADNALALNGEYKVMSAGATATFEFAEAGTIAFDTALFTPTYAITAAQGLTLTDATSGTVKTYTATATSTIPGWATDVDGQSVIDQEVSDKYAAWAKDIAGCSSAELTQDRSAQFLMNVPVAAEVALTIDGIEVTSDGTIVTIGATKTIEDTTDAIELGTTDAGTGVDTPAINGILNVMVAEELGSWTKKSIPAANLEFVGGKAQVLIPAIDGRFVKASVDYSTPASAITEVTE